MKIAAIQIVLLMVYCLSLSACKNTANTSSSATKTKIHPSRDSLVVLGRRYSSNNQTEADYISCIGEELGSNTGAFNIIPEQQFIDELYPFFETSTAPQNINNLSTLLQEPGLQKKFGEINLRYVIWVEGYTRVHGKTGSVSCAVGPGAAGCLGFVTWDEDANYQAKIWDVKALSLHAEVNTTSTGTSYMPAVIVPIPILARAQNSACVDMAWNIGRKI